MARHLSAIYPPSCGISGDLQQCRQSGCSYQRGGGAITDANCLHQQVSPLSIQGGAGHFHLLLLLFPTALFASICHVSSPPFPTQILRDFTVHTPTPNYCYVSYYCIVSYGRKPELFLQLSILSFSVKILPATIFLLLFPIELLSLLKSNLSINQFSPTKFLPATQFCQLLNS